MIKRKSYGLELLFPDEEEREVAKQAMLSAFSGNKKRYDKFIKKLDELKKLHGMAEKYDNSQMINKVGVKKNETKNF